MLAGCRRLLLVLIGLAATLSGCAARPARNPTVDAPDVRIAESELGRAPRDVTREEALADLARAVYVFDQAYAGVDGQARMPAPKRIADSQARIRSQPSWTPHELAEVLVDLLGQPDSHLSFSYGGPSPLRAVEARGAPLGTPPLDAPAVELTRGEVPVLAIRSFDNRSVDDMRRLPAIAAELRRVPRFVVDLRGNSGGNYSFAEAFLLELTDAELRRLDEREVVSIAAAEGRANAVRRQMAGGAVPASALPHYFAQLDALEAEAQIIRNSGAARTELTTAGATVRGRAPGPLRSRAVFLVDGGCASACEMMLALARQVPGIVVAGQSTRGGMAVGELAVFRLPNSGVSISLGTRAFHDPLGDFAETRGFAPDVLLDGADPISEAKTIASASAAVARRRVVSRSDGGRSAELGRAATLAAPAIRARD